MCDIVSARRLTVLALVWLAGSLWGGEVTEAEKAVAKLREQLEKPVSVEMVDVPMARALDLLARRAGVRFMLLGREDREAFKRQVNLTLDGARAVDILDVLCEESGLQYELRPDEVRISSVLDHRERRVKLCAYDVRDLTAVVRDFIAGGGALQSVYSQVPGPDQAAQGGAIANPFQAAAAAPTVTSANVADMIRLHVRPESWDPTLGTSIEERSGTLVVVQTEEVHAMIRRLLTAFRARQGRQVAIEGRVLALRSTDVDRVWRECEGRGVSAPALDAAAVAALDRLIQEKAAQELFSGSTVLYITQLGFLGDLKSRRLICDYEISGDSFDPVTGIVRTGTAIAIRPTLSDDAKWVTVDVRAAHTAWVGEPEKVQVVRGGEVYVFGDKDHPSQTQKIGSLQIQAPAMTRSRIAENLMLAEGQYAAFSAPFAAKDGLDYGREMLVILRCRALIAAAPPIEPEKKDIAELSPEMKTRLERRVDLTLIETPFQKAMEVFSQQAKVPVVLERGRLGGRLTKPVLLESKGQAAGEALTLLLRAGEAAIIPYPSLLYVTTRERVNSKRVTFRVFDVRDLTMCQSDYPGERIGDEAAAGSGGAGVCFVQPCASLVGLFSAPDIAQLLKERLFPAEFADACTSIEEQGGQLVVMQTPEVLAKIEEALVMFRQSARRPVSVTARWMVVKTADLKDALGADLPATLAPNDVPKALALLAKPDTRDLATARLVCFNGQKVSSFGGLEKAVVKDYDVSGAVMQPIVSSVRGGLVTEVEPLVIEGTGEKEFPTQIRLDVEMSLARTETAPADLELVPEKDGKPEPSAAAQPGKLHDSRVQKKHIGCSVRVVDGGAALFRMPPPEWLAPTEEAALGEKTLLVVLQATRQK